MQSFPNCVTAVFVEVQSNVEETYTRKIYWHALRFHNQLTIGSTSLRGFTKSISLESDKLSIFDAMGDMNSLSKLIEPA